MDLNRREFLRGAAVAGAGLVILPRLARATNGYGDGQWLAGDLHCHTVFSGDVYGGPDDDNTGLDEAYTFGWMPGDQIAIAKARGLDFLAITDHGDVRALSDAAYTGERDLILIPGYEHSLSKGHAGCLGVNAKLDIATGDDAGALALRDAVHAQNGVFILNHPFYDKGWRYSPSVRPDSIEVWNIGWPYRHIEDTGVPSDPSVSDNYKSLPYWEQSFLATGPMPATGGSDNHYRATTAVQGVGQPTTWVYAADRSWRSVLDGIVAGRTFVTAEPALMGGMRIELTASAGTSTWMVGDTVPSGAGAKVTARVLNATAHSLVFVVDGVARAPVTITSLDQTAELGGAAPANRVRVEVYLNEGYWMGGLTSPIYFA
jgi:hypothetical protein